MGHFMDDQEIEGHAKTRATGKPLRRIIMSHEDVARMLVFGSKVSTSLGAQTCEDLVRDIAESLQRAFDLGFRAAGGTVSAEPVIRKKK